jgi:outer membrane biosynthesis protein TonB
MANDNQGSRTFLAIVLGGIVLALVIAAFFMYGHKGDTDVKVAPPAAETPAEPPAAEVTPPAAEVTPPVVETPAEPPAMEEMPPVEEAPAEPPAEPMTTPEETPAPGNP